MPKSIFKLVAPEPTEAEIQASVLEYLWHDYRVAWCHRFNVGAMEVERMDKNAKWKKHYVRFAFPGCSDILGQLKDGRFLAVECKSRKGKLTDDQKRFIDMVISNNGVGIVARSIRDVVEALREEH